MEAKATIFRTGTSNNSEVESVEIDMPFYKRLIEIAADAFIGVRLEHIKANYILELEGAKDTSHLVTISKEFIENREFIDWVCSEKEKIEYNKL